jgi:hypothetical protein
MNASEQRRSTTADRSVPRRVVHTMAAAIVSAAVLSLGLASIAAAAGTLQVTAHFTEPIAPQARSGECPVAPEGFCGTGIVLPFGRATESIQFGAGCGGTCDARTVVLPQGTLILDETFSNGGCRGSCNPNPAFPQVGTLTDVVAGGTGAFAGATGTLSGSVTVAGGESKPVGESQVTLSGVITLIP